MMVQPVALDHVFLVVMVIVWPVAEYLYFYPRAVRGIKSGVTGARRGLYVYFLVALWGFTACVAALWMARGRSWGLLRLGVGTPLRLGIGLTIAAVFLALLWARRRAVLGRPERLKMVRKKLANAEPFMSQTLGEFRMFAAVSVSAGFCEEILFRGFVMWYVAAWFPVAWMGTVAAVVISSAFFGFAHIYLGWPNVLGTAVGGVFFALVVLASGSLWPAMIIHAAVDLSSGELGYHASRVS